MKSGEDSDCGLEQRVIRVSGQVQVKVQADTIRFSVGVEERGDDVPHIRSTVASKMTAVLMAIRKAGIADGDIQTDQISVSRSWERAPSKKDEYSGVYVWFARNTASVTTKEMSLAGTILDKAIEAGANSVSNLEFTLDDPTEVAKLALEEAVKDARSKAETIANCEGLNITGVQWIRESSGNSDYSDYCMSPPRPYSDITGPVETPVISGEIEIEASVEASYLFE